jgi:hypothetical protein
MEVISYHLEASLSNHLKKHGWFNELTMASGWEGVQRREIDGMLIRPTLVSHRIYWRQCRTGGVWLADQRLVPIAGFQPRTSMALL